MSEDQFHLARFIAAQDDGGTYQRALAELRSGHKMSHWMWFVFPQISGLGRSAMAHRYAISGLEEARAYLADPVLGPRLTESAQALLSLHPAPSAAAVLGSVDAMKLHSSMTLFSLATPDHQEFRGILEKYFGGQLDASTLERLPVTQ